MKNDNLLGTNGKTGSTAPVILQQNHQHLIGTTTAQSYENGFRKNGHIGNGVTGETQMNNKQQLPKKKRRQNKADLGSNFIAPDGGWGWLVVIAAGVSNLCVFPVLQQFGLLFAERLASIGLSTTQITTIINLNSCLTSCTGLINGPLFRRFSIRQVGLLGALLVTFALFYTSISDSFITYVLSFSLLYGIGSGINTSANSLALNTYFKEKRRIATGLSWTITGMGPIIMPQIIAIILPYYGVQGSLLIYTGLALNAVVCALIYQPVQWHVKKLEKPPPEQGQLNEALVECDYCSMAKRKNQSIFSSQYLYNADDSSITGYEIVDPGTPMLSLANDGWTYHGSRMSLTSRQPSRFGSRIASSQNLASNRTSYVNLEIKSKESERRKKISNAIKIEEAATEDCPSLKAPQDLSAMEKTVFPTTPTTPTKPLVKITIGPPEESAVRTPYRKKSTMNTFNMEKEVLKGASQKLEEYVAGKRNPTYTSLENLCTCDEQRRFMKESQLMSDLDGGAANDEKKYSLLEKITVFFDLDLLRDFTYVNLMMGVTLGNFAELNFSVLTPFVLTDWGFEKAQIATAMSLLGGVDISVRFFIPFIAGKIGWENRTFFLVGILGMAMGRIFITFFQSYTCILLAFCWIGLGKGLRTVFMALVIPSYVPLHRLPAASGLQLLFAGIFYFVMGPIIGYIRDETNYFVTLHCLNIATYIVATSWIGEKIYRSHQEKKIKRQMATTTTTTCDYERSDDFQ